MPADMDPNGKCCWTCKYQQTGGGTFLGWCLWFKEVAKEQAREIPGEVVDHGCDQYVRRTRP